MSSQVDLEKLGSLYSISVQTKPPETSEETRSRLAREEADATAKREADKAEAEHKRATDKADADHRRSKDQWTFLGGNLVFVALLVAAFVVACASSGDMQRWAMGLVTVLAGGLVGFIAGRLSVKPETK